jgi:glycosyltransferase involved in cell wall biosynthesis
VYGHGTWLPAIQHLSEVWTPSEFVSGVFRPHLDIPVRTVPHFIPQPNPETYQSVAPFVSDASATTFLAMADGRSSFHRKNLLGSIATFRTAFEGRDDVRLLLKSRNLMEFGEFRKDLMALIQGDTRIELIDRNLSSAEIWRLMHDSDCMLSPHRSEGFGIHLAEAMQIGRPVIATGWSGNTQFMTDENSLLIDYELQPVSDPFNVYSGLDRARWAEPDISSCVAAMRTIADNEDKRKEVGFLAQSSVRSCLGPEAWEKALKAPTQNLVV